MVMCMSAKGRCASLRHKFLTVPVVAKYYSTFILINKDINEIAFDLLLILSLNHISKVAYWCDYWCSIWHVGDVIEVLLLPWNGNEYPCVSIIMFCIEMASSVPCMLLIHFTFHRMRAFMIQERLLHLILMDVLWIHLWKDTTISNHIKVMVKIIINLKLLHCIDYIVWSSSERRFSCIRWHPDISSDSFQTFVLQLLLSDIW